MIIFFTGTGNSKFVADALAHNLQDEVTSLNDVLKNGLSREFRSEKPYVLVCPIYAWNLPPMVQNFISEAKFDGSSDMYVVVTMESETGKADEYASRLVSAKGMRFMGLTGVPMTNNYVNDPTPSDQTVRETNTRALKAVDAIAEDIQAGRTISKKDRTSLGGLKSGLVSRMMSGHDPGFKVTAECIGCGRCQRFCPANNITVTDGKPVFGKGCFQCYGCYHRCPKSAITAKGACKGEHRYVCPEYNPDDE